MCIFAEKKFMERKQNILCPHCGSRDLQKNGHRGNGDQRWHCNKCCRSFQQEYRYNARRQGIKDQIIELTLNSSGVRDISRILKISRNTVSSELKKKRQRKIKYDIDHDRLIKYLTDSNIEICSFEEKHLKQLLLLPYFEEHRDPTDRNIIAHAIADNRILISGDGNFFLYEGAGLKFLEI
jgi:transposase-like protein